MTIWGLATESGLQNHLNSSGFGILSQLTPQKNNMSSQKGPVQKAISTSTIILEGLF